MEGRKILVRSLARTDDDGCLGGRKYQATEFHVVDLERNEIDRCCFPTLIYFNGTGSMISTDTSVYILGGAGRSDPEPEAKPEFYWGGACLHLGSYPPSWARFQGPTVSRVWPQCAALKEKIYVFGCPRLVGPEVFDPVLGRWRMSSPLPRELHGSSLSLRVVTDPPNNRFLLHLSGGGLDPLPSLYAYYPDGGGSWKCLARDFQEWYHIAAVADNVLYFHDRKEYRSSVLGAYDLESGKWLDVMWTSPFEDNVEKSVARKEFDALLTLGPKTLCLATWNRIYPVGTPTKIRIDLVKFRADRSGSGISFTPLSSHSFDFAYTRAVQDFLAV